MEPGNLLKIDTLSEQWRDKDSVMLHACFQLLKDFIEKEDRGPVKTDWNINEDYTAAKKEIDELYNWWVSYSKTDEELDDSNHELENIMLIRLINVRWAMWT